MADLPDLGVPYRFEPALPGGAASHLALVLLHGEGGDESSLLDAARRVAPGAALFSPRGPFEHEGGWRHLPAPPPEDPEAFQDPDLDTPHGQAVHARTPELVELLATAGKELDLDPAELVAFGFADGATAAAALFYDHPDALRGAVLLSAREPFRPPRGRVLDHKEIFCATGRNDESVTMDDYEELVEGLVTAGADVELHWYDIGHDMSDQELDDVATWIGRRLTAR